MGGTRVVPSDARTQILGVRVTRIHRLIPGLRALVVGILLVAGVGLAERPVSRNISGIASEVLEILHD